MEKLKIGKNLKGIPQYITMEDLKEISKNMETKKSTFSNQQWAKIRKLVKKFIK